VRGRVIALRIGAILLVLVGIVGLVVGKISYDRGKRTTTIGPLQFTATQRETVDIPVWAGAGAITAGSLLLLATWRRKRT
jgi:hypothetical protein